MEKDLKELKGHIQGFVDKYSIKNISVYINEETLQFLGEKEKTVKREATIAVEV